MGTDDGSDAPKRMKTLHGIGGTPAIPKRQALPNWITNGGGFEGQLPIVEASIEPKPERETTVTIRLPTAGEPKIYKEIKDVDRERWQQISNKLSGFSVDPGLNTIGFNLEVFLDNGGDSRFAFPILLLLKEEKITIMAVKIHNGNFIVITNRAPEDLADVKGLTSGVDLTRKARIANDEGKSLFVLQLSPAEVTKLVNISMPKEEKEAAVEEPIVNEETETAQTKAFKEILMGAQVTNYNDVLFDPKELAGKIALAFIEDEGGMWSCNAWTKDGGMYRVYLANKETASIGLPVPDGFGKVCLMEWETFEVTVFKEK